MTSWLRPMIPVDNDDVLDLGPGARQPVLDRLSAAWDRAAVSRHRGERDQVRGELAVRDAQRARVEGDG